MFHSFETLQKRRIHNNTGVQHNGWVFNTTSNVNKNIHKFSLSQISDIGSENAGGLLLPVVASLVILTLVLSMMVNSIVPLVLATLLSLAADVDLPVQPPLAHHPQSPCQSTDTPRSTRQPTLLIYHYLHLHDSH